MQKTNETSSKVINKKLILKTHIKIYFGEWLTKSELIILARMLNSTFNYYSSYQVSVGLLKYTFHFY